MLLILLFINTALAAVSPKDTKPYLVLPFPLELPNRNDRSEQCWLRIEDVELTETITVYCHIAQSFLHNFIHEYNTLKIMEDDVDISLWKEEPIPLDNRVAPNKSESSVIDWKLTTILDPTVNRRIYVTKNADCKLIMYSREGMTSYEMKCDKILYFINSSTSSGSNKGVDVIVIPFIVLLLKTSGHYIL